MTPAKLDLSIRRGITFGPVQIICRNAAGDLVDLTGWQPFAEVRKKSGAEVILDFEPAITGPPTNGAITIPEVTDEETMALTAGTYAWDFILQTPTGDIVGPYISGKCVISDKITKSGS